MNQQEVEKLVTEELISLGEFKNFHGITQENLKLFVVSPYQVLVDPDDLKTEKRNMWVVLNPPGIYLIAYDPLDSDWSVIEKSSGNEYVQIVAGSSLAKVQDGM